MNGPLLAATVRQVAQADADTPFQYYGVQFMPIVERKFPRGEPLRVLFQILGAFRSAPESLAQISVSFWQAGKAAQARQVIQTARTLFSQDPLLEATERSFRHAQSH